MSFKTLRFVFGHGVTHARITPETTRIVPSGLMMFLIPVTEYNIIILLSMHKHAFSSSFASARYVSAEPLHAQARRSGWRCQLYTKTRASQSCRLFLNAPKKTGTAGTGNGEMGNGKWKWREMTNAGANLLVVRLRCPDCSVAIGCAGRCNWPFNYRDCLATTCPLVWARAF